MLMLLGLKWMYGWIKWITFLKLDVICLEMNDKMCSRPLAVRAMSARVLRPLSGDMRTCEHGDVNMAQEYINAAR